jgi:hypothetical protein
LWQESRCLPGHSGWKVHDFGFDTNLSDATDSYRANMVLESIPYRRRHLCPRSQHRRQLRYKIKPQPAICNRPGFVAAVADAHGTLNASADFFNSSMRSIGVVVAIGTSYFTDPSVAIGGSAAVWSFSLLAATFAVVGACGSCAGLSGCLWVCYPLGVLNVVLFFALFTTFFAIAIPAGEVCAAPATPHWHCRLRLKTCQASTPGSPVSTPTVSPRPSPQVASTPSKAFFVYGSNGADYYGSDGAEFHMYFNYFGNESALPPLLQIITY